jgi:hypothetical protein
MAFYFSCASNLQQDLMYMGLQTEASFIHITTSPNKQPFQISLLLPQTKGPWTRCVLFMCMPATPSATGITQIGPLFQ